MSESQNSKAAWLGTTLSLLGIIALVMVIWHRSDPALHNMGGDSQQGSKKFDHIELLNIGQQPVQGIKIILADKQGDSRLGVGVELVADLGPGESKFWAINDDGLAVKQVILEYVFLDGQQNMLRRRTIQVHDPYLDDDHVRAVTFWCDSGQDPDLIPEFWGHGLIVNMLDQRQNCVLTNVLAGADQPVD